MFLALLSPAGWALIAGGLLYQAASIFDGVDGEMARATFRSSRPGAAADSLIDMATNLLFIVGVTIQAARGGWMMPAYAGMLALVIIPLGLAVIGAKAIAGGGPLTFDLLKAQVGQDPAVGGGGTARLAVTLTSRDVYSLYFSAMAVCGLTAAILFPLAIFALIWITVVLLVVARPDEKVEILPTLR
jgi:CDP-L-myo-inositol myo-inositolphosphotransferase